MNLSENELKILRPILEECENLLGRKTCNDVRAPNTPENRAILKEMYLANVNGDEEKYKEEYKDWIERYEKTYANGDPIELNLYFQDWWVFEHLMRKAGLLK